MGKYCCLFLGANFGCSCVCECLCVHFMLRIRNANKMPLCCNRYYTIYFRLESTGNCGLSSSPSTYTSPFPVAFPRFSPRRGENPRNFSLRACQKRDRSNSHPQLKLQIRAQAIGRDKCIFLTCTLSNICTVVTA